MANLPDRILAHTGRVIAIERSAQSSTFQTCILTCANGRFVLKIGDTAPKISKLLDEFGVLEALKNYRPFVPQPILYSIDDGIGMFLFNYIDGESILDALEHADTTERHKLVAEFGHTLRKIHTWTPYAPRPTDWISDAMKRAAANVAVGRIDNPIIRSGRPRGRNPIEMLSDLYAWHSKIDNDVVFCHGNYCLTNILVLSNRIVGVVDWSTGGYADRRLDLAVGRWTIRHSLGSDEYVDTFLRAYGYNVPSAILDNFEALYALLL